MMISDGHLSAQVGWWTKRQQGFYRVRLTHIPTGIVVASPWIGPNTGTVCDEDVAAKLYQLEQKSSRSGFSKRG